ncbi:N-acetylmuramoyl-L-alanine amidase [Streptomyces sp. NPDC006208]|uniref:N-acetylmuramoyl-L-alanine amidase n=1 Tax=Streptomyces sp. NPDC006208 TaxID=3156734 RepID=UPI0033BBA1D5
MATPLSADRLLQALRDEGLTVVEHRSWESNNRNHRGPWGPMHGVMIHHTVTSGDTAKQTLASVELCYNGHSALPGPLCQGVIAKDGTVYLVGNGRANHAGLGDPDVLRAVINQTDPPTDNEATVDGNRHFYGFECINRGDGADPWPEAQLLAIEKAAAAICRAHGWSAKSAIRHLDWQPGKVDPRGVDWPTLLARISARLGTPKPSAPAPTPQRPTVDLSRLVAAARSDPAKAGTPVTYSGVRTVEAALVDAGLLAKRYSDGHFGRATVQAYAAWQRKLGYSGTAADGIPGRTSLTKLGTRYGFSVTA